MTPNEEQTVFYENLGRCIAGWSHVEDGLHAVYSAAIAPSNESHPFNLAAQAGYCAINAPDGKMSITSAAVHFRLMQESKEDDDPYRNLLGSWYALRKRVNKRRERRNQLAHFQVLNSINNRSGRRIELRPAIFNPNALLKRPLAFYCEHLKTIARSFGRTAFDLDTFAYGFSLQLNQCESEPSYDERLTTLLAPIGKQEFPTSEFV